MEKIIREPVSAGRPTRFEMVHKRDLLELGQKRTKRFWNRVNLLYWIEPSYAGIQVTVRALARETCQKMEFRANAIIRANTFKIRGNQF